LEILTENARISLFYVEIMDIFTKLFGGAAKVKIMKLFLMNEGAAYDNKEISERAKVRPSSVRRELSTLDKMKLIRRRTYFKEQAGKAKKRRTHGWSLNADFPYLKELQNLLVNITPLNAQDITARLSRCGKLKLVIIAGVFIQDPDSRIDLMIVGDNMRVGILENAIKILESEIGRELRYTLFDAAEFKYRLGIYDKLVRDVLDYSHEVILDRLGMHYGR
jgi:hypothetical protein